MNKLKQTLIFLAISSLLPTLSSCSYLQNKIHPHYKKHSFYGDKIKIFANENFMLIRDKDKLRERKAQALEIFDADVKEVLFNVKDKNNPYPVSVAFLLIPANHEELEKKEEFLNDYFEDRKEVIHHLNSLKAKGLPSDVIREKNSVLEIYSDTNNLRLGFITVINNIPLLVMADISQEGKKFSSKEITKFSNEMLDYIDFLEKKNQE